MTWLALRFFLLEAILDKLDLIDSELSGMALDAQSLELLNNEGIEPEVVEYLTQPPDKEALENILDLLGMEPADLMYLIVIRVFLQQWDKDVPTGLSQT